MKREGVVLSGEQRIRQELTELSLQGLAELSLQGKRELPSKDT